MRKKRKSQKRGAKYRIAYVRGVFRLRTGLSPSLESWGET